jgi:hypothetical protein
VCHRSLRLCRHLQGRLQVPASEITAERISVGLPHVLCLAMFLLISAEAEATTVIAVTTDTAAYIGADSRTQPRGNMCKIIVSGLFAVGMSGQLADRATKFNPTNVIRHAILRSKDLSSAINAAVMAIEPSLERSMKWGFSNSRAEYLAKYQGKLAFALLFIGIEQGKPRIVFLAWRTDNGGISRLPPRSFDQNSFDGMGTFDAVVIYIIKNPNWRLMNPMLRITTALQVQSEATPSEVGPPFSILRITGSGPDWIERGACAAK